MQLAMQFLRFAGVGVVGTAVQYLVLWVAVTAFALPAVPASAVGYAIGVLVSYFLNYPFTFRSDQPHGDAVPRYFAVFGVGWCLNAVLMALLVGRLGWNIWLSQVLTTSIGLVWNFSGSRWWTFRPGAEPSPRSAQRDRS